MVMAESSRTESLVESPQGGWLRVAGRLLLVVVFLMAGIGHFIAADSFLGQVPPLFPFRLPIVYVSGVIELTFAAGLLLAGLRGGRHLPRLGWILAAFFVVIFPGNISQFVTGADAFGLDTDVRRFLRLLFQPVLVAWALWCTGAWSAWRTRLAGRSRVHR